jgi:hypothetical protein
VLVLAGGEQTSEFVRLLAEESRPAMCFGLDELLKSAERPVAGSAFEPDEASRLTT